MSLGVVAAFLLAAAAPDVPVETLRAIADRFDRAQIAQDRATLEAMTAPDLVFVGSDGRRQDRAAFIAGWMDPRTRYEPIEVTDRYLLPLGPDSFIAGGDVVVRGTSGSQPFAVRIRFSDTFRRTGGRWRAVHIQATRVPEPAAAP
jgi:ketosteroid isomerase-like protein